MTCNGRGHSKIKVRTRNQDNKERPAWFPRRFVLVSWRTNTWSYSRAGTSDVDDIMEVTALHSGKMEIVPTHIHDGARFTGHLQKVRFLVV